MNMQARFSWRMIGIIHHTTPKSSIVTSNQGPHERWRWACAAVVMLVPDGSFLAREILASCYSQRIFCLFLQMESAFQLKKGSQICMSFLKEKKQCSILVTHWLSHFGPRFLRAGSVSLVDPGEQQLDRL
jgi:hypothetical protein